MKKLVAIFMILLFGVSSSGATIQLHYCCGKLKTISFGSIHEKDCGMQGEMGSKPCCETKSISAKEQASEHEVFTINPGIQSPVEPGWCTDVTNLPVYVPQTATVPFAPPSPPLAQDICVLHCVFRI